MSFLDSIFSQSRKLAENESPSSDHIASLWAGPTTYAGLPVDEVSALNYSAVWACVRIISETLASMPFRVVERERTYSHVGGPIETLLDVQPNPEMDAVTWREMFMSHVLTWGNAICEIERSRSGQVIALWPRHPSRVKVERTKGGELYYDIDKGMNEPNAALRTPDVLHFKGLSGNGVVGYSPIQKARETIALGGAMEAYGARFFGNDARPSVVLKHPRKLTREARQNIRDEWNELHRGPANSHGVAVLYEGMEMTAFGIPPEESQFLESRKFQVEEIAGRWYRVPLHLVGHMENATFSNIEHQAMEFVRYTLRHWAKKIETEIALKLLPEQQRARHNFNSLLRGDTKTRGEFYRTLSTLGVLSINEVRVLEDMDPIGEEGDQRFIQGAMVPIDTAGEDAVSAIRQEVEAVGTADRSLWDRIASALAPAFADATERLIRKECNAAKRAASKQHDAFVAWADKFYSEGRGEEMYDCMVPVCESCMRAGNVAARPYHAHLSNWCESVRWESHDALVEAHAVGGRTAVVKLCDDWMIDRAPKIALLLSEAIHQEMTT